MILRFELKGQIKAIIKKLEKKQMYHLTCGEIMCDYVCYFI